MLPENWFMVGVETIDQPSQRLGEGRIYYYLQEGLNGNEFEQTPGDSEGQQSLACCNPLGYKELDTT